MRVLHIGVAFPTALVTALALQFALADQAEARCNTRDGIVADQPDPPADDETNIDATLGQSVDVSSAQNDRLDDQTLKLDLSRDIVSLTHFNGALTSGVPVLGVRMENLPGFDAKKHCNAIQPILYKPKIERLPTGEIRATVENGRFHIQFDPSKLTSFWYQDVDATKQFFWIFPAAYGHSPKTGKPWSLTKSYDEVFQTASPGSVKRRWTAEAFIDLSMRQYRERALSHGYPSGWRPTRDDLDAAISAQLDKPCGQVSSELLCLASALIETNEAPPPSNLISSDAFKVGDALLENSGVSAGIRQLDFGTGNKQASQLVKQLLPTTLGRYPLGYGYRRPIRAWDITSLNNWYGQDGIKANGELSQDSAKKLLLYSHASFLRAAVRQWTGRISAAYPNWSGQQQEALELISIDIENVSGFQMHLPSAASDMCDVLTNTTVLRDGRSNHVVIANQIRRVRNGEALLKTVPEMITVNWSCIDAL